MSLRISYLLQTFLPTSSLQRALTSSAAQTPDLLMTTEPALMSSIRHVLIVAPLEDVLINQLC